MTRALLCSVLFLTLCISAYAQGDTLRVFEPGQVWTIRNAPSEDVRLVIGKIESLGAERICHVSLLNIPSPPNAPLPKPRMSIAHMPFACNTLESSVDTLVGENASLDANFESGYAYWKSAEGGYFTVSVADAIEITFTTLGQGKTAK